MATDIKLTIKSRLSSDLRGSHIIIGKFHEACEQLDASIFEPFIKEDEVFEDVGKWEFLQMMKDLFDHCRNERHISSTERQDGVCNLCNRGQRVTEYLKPGTQTVLFAYYFELSEGQLTDVYRCHSSSGSCF